MNVYEARKVLALEAKRVWEKDLHPDGLKLEYYVHDREGQTLPHVGITLYANGTWEYTDPDLRPEE